MVVERAVVAEVVPQAEGHGRQAQPAAAGAAVVHGPVTVGRGNVGHASTIAHAAAHDQRATAQPVFVQVPHPPDLNPASDVAGPAAGAAALVVAAVVGAAAGTVTVSGR
ncbi:hypothetical protein GCM10007977_016860 [Dactylosporangium sucinum]|uniref:Uncharacterized protein n=1 Tax=Dactylosporangium sucinum TaxID=1424081 RepID=A0A917WMD4_9ACTN|nr:hypothetical protein GCM10007977_016860 [Dactylosporangium sucinum]